MEHIGKKIAVLGGDKRERTVIQKLLAQHYQVTAFALPKAMLPEGVCLEGTAAAALDGADACILPLPPLGENGKLHSILEYPCFLDAGSFAAMPEGFPILTGMLKPSLQALTPQCRIIAVMEQDALALPLAEATAEGALAEAIRLSDALLFGAQALVIGYGRVGRALAWRLEALGMHVVVVNRGDVRAAEARDFGFHVGDWSQLTALASQSAFVFNTVPAPVLAEAQLRWLMPQSIVIDLAEKPGGTDFKAASEVGIKAVLASGLPGKYAPLFAGEAMADAYLEQLSLLFGEEAAQ